ncbi:unnamed protein product, partial [marine sediment metagenome]
IFLSKEGREIGKLTESSMTGAKETHMPYQHKTQLRRGSAWPWGRGRFLQKLG